MVKTYGQARIQTGSERPGDGEVGRETYLVNWKATKYIKPHEYITKEVYPELFSTMAEEIKEKGYDKDFSYMGHTKRFRYYDSQGYTYWIVGNCLNRYKIE